MKSALVSSVDRLLESQAAAWPMLTRGMQGLRESRTRVEPVFGRDVVVRHIPHRIRSTTAPVDPVSVAERPCFLCPANLDPEEQGIEWESGFILYCNPFPILERHLTIVHRDHRPQRIAGQFETLLRMSQALPDSFVIYNGPECGASAPDHLHFQSASRELFPVERLFVPDAVPRAFIVRGSDAVYVTRRLQALFEALTGVVPGVAEPMINIAAYFADPEWTVLVFPRGRHRPRVYETKEFTVSPATIDLCGVFVVPVSGDFERIRGTDIENVFSEVTLSKDVFESISRRWGGA